MISTKKIKFDRITVDQQEQFDNYCHLACYRIHVEAGTRLVALVGMALSALDFICGVPIHWTFCVIAAISLIVHFLIWLKPDTPNFYKPYLIFMGTSLAIELLLLIFMVSKIPVVIFKETFDELAGIVLLPQVLLCNCWIYSIVFRNFLLVKKRNADEDKRNMLEV